MFRKDYLFFFLAFICLLATLVWELMSSNAVTNMYFQTALAWLNGKVTLSHFMPDVAQYGGNLYNPFPPFPAFLLVPIAFLAKLGIQTNTLWVSLFLFIVTSICFYQVFKKIGLMTLPSLWLVVAFLLGTGYWYCLRKSNYVWFFAHISATAALTFALRESFYKGRGWVIGLCIGAAFLSRQMTIFSILFFTVFLWNKYAAKGKQWKPIITMFIAVGVSISLYFYYNYLRFGNFLDTGYGYVAIGKGSLFEGVTAEKGLFNAYYFVYNLIYFFFQGFQVKFTEPNYWCNLEMDMRGSGLPAVSPFVMLAFYAKNVPVRLKIAIWLSCLFILVPTLFYHNNGAAQINTYRFSLDFLPLLMILIAYSVKNISSNYWKVFIIYAVLLNMLALSGLKLIKYFFC
jgi:hypothetical protein